MVTYEEIDELYSHLLDSATPQFIEYLRGEDAKENEGFSTAIRIARKHYLSAVSFQDEFGVSAGTVSRWVRGKSTPHKMARPGVLEWIVKQIDE